MKTTADQQVWPRHLLKTSWFPTSEMSVLSIIEIQILNLSKVEHFTNWCLRKGGLRTDRISTITPEYEKQQAFFTSSDTVSSD